MRIQTKPITLLDFAKLAIYGIFLNYYCYYILRGQFLKYGTGIFFTIALICTILSMIGDKIYVGTEMKCWIAYLVLSLLTVPFALSSSTALNGISKYGQRIAIIAIIAYICEREKTVKFAIRLLAVTAVACAASCLIMNTDISSKLELESGANISTNDIGSIMAFGCFAVLFAFGLKEKKGVIKTIIKIGYILAAVSVIFIAGSRKSILAILIFFALLFLFCGRDYFSKMSTTRFVIVTLLIIGTVIIVYYYLLPNVESTDMYLRVWGRKAESAAESDQGRIDLYKDALSTFFNNLLCGVGFNNFGVDTNTYSHSTYVEPLACSGIIGFLYLVPYVTILVKQIKLIRINRVLSEERLWQKELLAFYISFLFVGIGIPYIYKDIPCIILAMFIASQKISFDKLNEAEITVVSEGVNSETITD